MITFKRVQRIVDGKQTSDDVEIYRDSSYQMSIEYADAIRMFFELKNKIFLGKEPLEPIVLDDF